MVAPHYSTMNPRKLALCLKVAEAGNFELEWEESEDRAGRIEHISRWRDMTFSVVEVGSDGLKLFDVLLVFDGPKRRSRINLEAASLDLVKKSLSEACRELLSCETALVERRINRSP